MLIQVNGFNRDLFGMNYNKHSVIERNENATDCYKNGNRKK